MTIHNTSHENRTSLLVGSEEGEVSSSWCVCAVGVLKRKGVVAEIGF